MKLLKRNKNENESTLLIDPSKTSANYDNQQQSRSVNLAWAESSWIHWPFALLFCWINPLFSYAHNGTLKVDELGSLPDSDKCSTLYTKTTLYNLVQTSLLKIVIEIFWKRFLFIGSFLLPMLVGRITGSMFLYGLVLDIINDQTSSSMTIPSTIYVYLYAIGIFACEMLYALTQQQYYFHSNRLGLMLRNTLSSIIYTRLLQMRAASLQEIAGGQAMNLLANDLTKFEDCMYGFHFLWAGPLEMLIVFGTLSWIIGVWPTAFGFCVVLLLMLVQMLYSRKFSHYRETTMTYADKRIHAYEELIHGYEVIKIYNWEQPIMNHIREMREYELATIRRASFLRALSMPLFLISMSLIGLVIFMSAWLIGQPLTVTSFFIALTFFGRMRTSTLYELPVFFEKFSEIRIVWKRIDTFLQLTMRQPQTSSMSGHYQNENRGTILMHDASFSWNKDSICLSSINIRIQSGSFIGITGPVGSGKSSLLAAILGEMIQVNGQFDVNRSSFSYAAQSPWIFSDTLRANILFGKPFDEQRYKHVIHGCCLDVDLAQFGASGDLTMIGERGVNLSGGQKSRVALARALYAHADVYLLDDPLAAVDRLVAKQIYDRCIGPHGLLKDKTRLLVTHQIELMVDTDRIIVLAHGQIQKEDRLDEPHDLIENESTITTSMLEINQATVDMQSIIEEEVSSNLSVDWSVWYSLFAAPPLGIFGLCLMIFLLLIAEILYDGTNLWLSLQSLPSNNQGLYQPKTIYVYLGLTIGALMALVVRGIFFYYHTLKGSNHLHEQMLTGLLYTPVRFYESNPSGRILNRVSKDQQVVDEVLPSATLEAAQLLLMSAGALIITCIIDFRSIFLVIITMPLLYILHSYYMKLNYPLKRLESITRSPVYAHFSASLNGLTTIRSFKAENHWIEMFFSRVDTNTQAYISMVGASRWFGVRVDMVVCFYLLIFAIFAILSRDNINPSLLTLSFMSIMNITGWCQWGIRKLSDSKALMTSAERILEYAQLPRETDNISRKENLAPSDWPNRGVIEFRKYSMRYRSGLETALKDIDLRISPGEKIGIIGRTGAGKSSLFRSLLRLVDQDTVEGQILIDQIDINHVTLAQLRSCFSVIPQRPMLFTGTLRYNIDPQDIYSDEQCWKALEAVQLKQWVSEHATGLLMFIHDGGSNLSVGQCHLVCVARALVKQCVFLLVDEATANVDKKTDELLQSIIAEQFSDRTVLTIAHRLNTVSNSDRILVLDGGRVTDFDVPNKILPNFQA